MAKKCAKDENFAKVSGCLCRMLDKLFAPMQFLAQGFVILVAGGMQHAQAVAVAADADFVEILDV